jgi:hypothetical protein
MRVKAAAYRAIGPSPETVIGTETDQRVGVAGVTAPGIKNLVGLSLRPAELLRTRLAILIQAGTIQSDPVEFLQIGTGSGCSIWNSLRPFRLAEKARSPAQQPIDFTWRHLAVAQGRGVAKPPFGGPFMLSKIDR